MLSKKIEKGNYRLMKIDTVCIIDDDPICVYGTKVLLNHNNFVGSNILVYEDGYEALVNLTSLLNGWEFLDEFNKLSFTNKPKVYIVSSQFDLQEIEKGKSYDFVRDFISKPLIESKLASIFQNGIIKDEN